MASALRSVISFSAVISSCLPRGTSWISPGGQASYSRGNAKGAMSCVAIVADVLWSQMLS